MPRPIPTGRRSDRPRIPKNPQANRYAERYIELLQRKDAQELKRVPSVKKTRSTESNTYHPPSLDTAVSPIQRDDRDTEVTSSSLARVTSGVSVVYHPPAKSENTDKHDQIIENNRYRAALEASFTPKGMQNFSRKMDNRIIQIMSTETDSTMGNYTTDTASGLSPTNTYGTSYTNASSAGDSPRHSRVALGLSSDYSHGTNMLADDLQEQAQDDYFRVKQPFGYCSIAISAIQLFVLMMQLALCGVAAWDVNKMIGPYPETFSEWGGKNAYYIISERQYFRLVTPAILHVGILHLLCNAYVQLETCAFFEREWGSFRWILLYILSEIGSVAISCIINPETIAVGSSGALMGLFGAKFAQLATYSNFELVGTKDPTMRLEQLSGIMCSISIIAVLSFVNYIDWSGHAGGFCTGFCAGIVASAGPIRSTVSKVLWILFGVTLLSTGLYFMFDTLFTKIEPDSDLADACMYFRSLYPEDYDCQCIWG